MKRTFSILAGCAILITLLSCGYTTKSTLSGDVQTIHIAAFDNKVSYAESGKRNLYIPLLEIDVRNAIIDRFLFDGNLTVAEEQTADLVLKGSLINYNRQGLRFDSQDDVEEYRVHIIVSLEMYDGHSGELRWSERRFAGEATYFISGPEATTEESAIQEAVIDLSRRIVERTVEDW